MLVFQCIVFSCFEDLNEPVPAPVINDYQRHQDLEKIVKEKDEEINKLKKKLEIERFSIERFSKDNSMILFFTVFISYSMFITFFEFVKPAANTITTPNLIYIIGTSRGRSILKCLM